MSEGQRVVELRARLGYTQAKDFASAIGISRSALSMIEKGERKPNHDFIAAVVASCNVDPRYFYTDRTGSYLIDDPGDAVMGNGDKPITKAESEAVMRKIQQLDRAWKEDPVAHRVSINAPLRDFVEQVQHLDATMLNQLKGVIFGYMARDKQDRDDEPKHIAG